MPKIIKNLDEKINNTALYLFSTRGYNQVTMKLIADETGVAVGTLYNYYTNKMNLFISVFKEYLSQLSELLHEIIENKGDLK
ncbi:MAG: TetR/AcrR family transcriptional regulator, partial [Halanaerobiaceae bacterium]|nr:TetR/AcrR family transcriptional regulator [Halanaerobiaceae bacterium]